MVGKVGGCVYLLASLRAQIISRDYVCFVSFKIHHVFGGDQLLDGRRGSHCPANIQFVGSYQTIILSIFVVGDAFSEATLALEGLPLRPLLLASLRLLILYEWKIRSVLQILATAHFSMRISREAHMLVF